MPELSQLIADAKSLTSSNAFRGELAGMRAKATLSELLGEPPSYDWKYLPDRVVRQAVLLHHVARLSVEADPSSISELAEVTLVTARAWESLAALGERVGRPLALINAAVAYELAGFQANAACLARASVSHRDWEGSPTVEGLASAFIQRMFVRVRSINPSLMLSIQSNNEDLAGRIGSASAILLARGLDQGALYFLSGNPDLLGASSESLRLAEKGFLQLGDVSRGNLTGNLRTLLPVMADRSTWRLLGDRHEGGRWTRYIKSLARGLGTSILDSRSISELWPSQIEAVENGLLEPSTSKVVRMPTSAGKTRVAELAIVDSLVSQPGSRALYIAPYKALVTEIEESFANLFADLGFSATSILGAYEQGLVDTDLAHDAQVLVLTPEKADLLVRIAPENLSGVNLVVLDEGQLVGDPSRGVHFEFLVSRLRLMLPDARFLLLSSVVSNQTLRDFAAWLKGKDSDVITSDWRPTIQRVARFDWSGISGRLVYLNDRDDAALDRYIPNLVQQQVFELVNPKTQRRRTVRFPGPTHRAQISAALAYELAPRGPVLIFCTQPDWAEAAATALSDRVEYAREVEEDPPECFRPSTPPRSQAIAAEWLGADHEITVLLGKGIAVHHSRLPDALRQAIEADVRHRRLAVVAATTTLAQGVNLPVRTVIFHSTRRYDQELERSVPIPPRDYWNMAGRAGRAGAETEGTVIHLSLNQTDRSDYSYFVEHRLEVDDLDSRLYAILADLLNNRITVDDAADLVDPDILGLLVEEAAYTDEDLMGLLEATLAAKQAQRRGSSVGPLASAFRLANERIAATVPSVEARRLFATTGLRTSSCISMADHVQRNKAQLASLLESATFRDVTELLQVILAGLADVSEMQPRSTISKAYEQALSLWIAGSSLQDIGAELEILPGEDLSEFVEEYFAYLLPWGISSYTRIAAGLLGTELSPFVSSLASHVKYGVPTTEAVWAMTYGITSRSVAILVGDQYRMTTLTPSHRGFRGWLSSLDAERFAEALGIEGVDLESTARAAFRSHESQLFARLDSGAPLLPETVHIRLQPGLAERIPEAIRPGTLLEVVRDVESGVDRSATRLEANSFVVAYLPRSIAQLIGPEIDAGMAVRAVVESTGESDDGRQTLTVLLEEDLA